MLPTFLPGVLRGSAGTLGLIEGLSDALLGVAKLLGGPLANQPARRVQLARGGCVATREAEMALAMRAEAAKRTDPSGQPLQVRIGLDTGPVVAGVIGTSKFSYDLWGDTVNTASRMESQGLPGCIQVTDRTWKRLGDAYRFQRRGPIQVKGKGELVTYLLLGTKQQSDDHCR